MSPSDPPAFDSVERALVFAFNSSETTEIASPVMNRAMSEVPVKPKRKRKAKKGEDGPPEPPEKVRPSPPPAQPGERLRGLNKAMQAGIILQVVKRLDPIHADILAARYTHPTTPCQCQAMCCRGFRPVQRWTKAIYRICEALKETADVTRTPGKRGLSTEPTLRRLLVERYFLGLGQSTVKLARIAKVSHITAAKHDEWIRAYIEEEETRAKLEIAAIFDQEGITGFLE